MIVCIDVCFVKVCVENCFVLVIYIMVGDLDVVMLLDILK